MVLFYSKCYNGESWFFVRALAEPCVYDTNSRLFFLFFLFDKLLFLSCSKLKRESPLVCASQDFCILYFFFFGVSKVYFGLSVKKKQTRWKQKTFWNWRSCCTSIWNDWNFFLFKRQRDLVGLRPFVYFRFILFYLYFFKTENFWNGCVGGLKNIPLPPLFLFVELCGLNSKNIFMWYSSPRFRNSLCSHYRPYNARQNGCLSKPKRLFWLV